MLRLLLGTKLLHDFRVSAGVWFREKIVERHKKAQDFTNSYDLISQTCNVVSESRDKMLSKLNVFDYST